MNKPVANAIAVAAMKVNMAASLHMGYTQDRRFVFHRDDSRVTIR